MCSIVSCTLRTWEGARVRCSCTARVSQKLSFTQMLQLPHCQQYDGYTCLAAKHMLQQAQGRGWLWDNLATALSGSSPVRGAEGQQRCFPGCPAPC